MAIRCFERFLGGDGHWNYVLAVGGGWFEGKTFVRNLGVNFPCGCLLCGGAMVSGGDPTDEPDLINRTMG